MIDKKALSWVVRAADFDNYYVVKLVVLKPGPLPTIGMTRYAVINGKAQNRADTMAFDQRAAGHAVPRAHGRSWRYVSPYGARANGR